MYAAHGEAAEAIFAHRNPAGRLHVLDLHGLLAVRVAGSGRGWASGACADAFVAVQWEAADYVERRLRRLRSAGSRAGGIRSLKILVGVGAHRQWDDKWSRWGSGGGGGGGGGGGREHKAKLAPAVEEWLTAQGESWRRWKKGELMVKV